MNSKQKLSIIVPAYNEAERISPTLKSLRDYFEKSDVAYEVIVVDDGSTDDTVRVVREAMKHDRNLKLYTNDQNNGKGYAVNYGMSYASGDILLYIDADGAISIDHLDVFLEKIDEGHDVVIGSIEVSGHRAEDNNEWYRRALGKMSKVLVRTVATPGIYDTQRAFKVFTRKSAQNIFPRQTIKRWGFDIELLVIARKHKYQIAEIPVTWINPTGSHVEGMRHYIATLFELSEIVGKSVLGFYRPSQFSVWRQKERIISTFSDEVTS